MRLVGEGSGDAVVDERLGDALRRQLRADVFAAMPTLRGLLGRRAGEAPIIQVAQLVQAADGCVDDCGGYFERGQAAADLKLAAVVSDQEADGAVPSPRGGSGAVLAACRTCSPERPIGERAIE